MYEKNIIVTTIHKYRKEYVKTKKLPELYCIKNDGTHLPLIVMVQKDDSVYLSCYSCDFVKQAGLMTVENLSRLMTWKDQNPDEKVDIELEV